MFLTFDFFIHCNNRLPRYISCLAIENCYFHFLDRFLSCVLRLTINVFNFSIAIEVEFLKCYFQFSLFNQTKTTSFILFAQVDRECAEEKRGEWRRQLLETTKLIGNEHFVQHHLERWVLNIVEHHH